VLSAPFLHPARNGRSYGSSVVADYSPHLTMPIGCENRLG
jgi:hypothetical protein